MSHRKTITIIITFTIILISLLSAGCAQYEVLGYTVTITPSNSTSEDIVPKEVENSTSTTTITATPTLTSTPTPTPTPEPTPRRDPITNFIRIEGHRFTPSGDIQILVGDTVQWRNFEAKKNPRELISEDGLWEEPIHLNFMMIHEYTFNETGTFTFSLMYNEHASRQEISVI